MSGKNERARQCGRAGLNGSPGCSQANTHVHFWNPLMELAVSASWRAVMDEGESARIASECFAEFRKNHPVRDPNLRSKEYDDEVDDLTASDEVRDLSVAPARDSQFGKPRDDSMHIWLIASDAVQYAIEKGALGRSTSRGRLAHTNLSGGKPAHCGGELWFHDEIRVYVTGCSGRYAPRSDLELHDAVECFRGAGYEVASAGWDAEAARPNRTFRDSPQWQ